ncbi:carbon-monoxide dehydrogenase medium subunit [Kibdelosporangium banguiense]|uniref:Carbon-monoxide dehydrogenase medium subunit n=1 Tax=Kibdelosporangium banguiense TaxID=1365924 RepID=A0ABS4TC45_9PSEU|nr:carbon-monoxide dehydrogenase medium subunit [Kibdelosporangium banguiense]
MNDTIEQLAELGPDAKILAGGQSLVAMMNFRLARPSALVDITRVAGLDYLERDVSGLRIGALTRHRTVETTKIDGFRVLSKAARWIGHYPIRCRGTFGGSLAHGDSTAEWCILAVLLDAVIVLQGPAGKREVAAEQFFHGFFMTAAEPDEMIVEVRFPKPAPHAALTEFSQRQGDFAIVAASARLDLAENEVLTSKIVLGGVAEKPKIVEIDLAGRPATEETWRAAGETAAAQVNPPSDGHGSGEYRKKLTATLVARALAEAAA